MKRIAAITVLLLLATGIAYAKAYEIAKKAGNYDVTFALDKTAFVGNNNAEITVKDAAGNPLTDKVTFATMNVFGRNLNGISKLTGTSPGGRDHYGNHNVMVITGKNVKPSVIGGVVADSKGTYLAAGINSTTGAAAMGTDADIDQAHTQVSAARTLGAALGIPDAVAANDYIAAAGGKVVTAALANLPGS